jgi:xanthine dehydrogenase accessory factor
LACGGKISVAVEPLDRDWWRVVSEGIRQDRSQVTVTILDGAVSRQKVLLDSEEGIRYTTDSLNDEQRNRLVSVGQLALDTRSSARTTVGDFDVLIDVHRPRPRLVIVGGAHVAMSLVHYAQHLGFGTVLIDPRRAFATAERFPDVDTISYSYPDKALTEEFQLDSETYVAILTHDPKIDDRALQVALSSDVPYIGVLSSKRTHEKRLIRLTEVGVDPALFDRIRTPIGLDISARTPEEIALCIMAEIVAVRNGAAV